MIIVILVVVVSVIFLGISLRGDRAEVPTSVEITKFLQTSSKITTECAQDYEPNFKDFCEYIMKHGQKNNTIYINMGQINQINQYSHTIEVNRMEYVEKDMVQI